MTPIQKAKEIRQMLIDFSNYPAMRGAERWVDEWLEANPEAQALLSGEDWISVETEKPGHNQIVDAYDGKNRRCQYDAETKQFYRHTDFCDGDRLMRPYYPNVTHWKWIDFPEPPKP